MGPRGRVGTLYRFVVMRKMYYNGLFYDEYKIMYAIKCSDVRGDA